MKKVLIVEDDITFRVMLKTFLEKRGFFVEVVSKANEGIQLVKLSHFDLALIDLRLPDKNGIDLLKEIRGIQENLPVILMTSYADIKTAVIAIKHGAFEYISKPINTDELISAINNALKEKYSLNEDKKEEKGLGFIQGESELSNRILAHIELVAPTNISVVILGESGTGKEYVARMIHLKSSRGDKPFIAVDCGALSKDLAGSELFGHVKGSFTGAISDKIGNFEAANGGTLFLDEIGNLSYDIQIKLLRALQERKVKRIGSNDEKSVDVRVIVATNDNLSDLVKEGKFREDLYHRLNEFQIKVSPLRERKEDIILFAKHFLNLSNKELGRSVNKINDAVMEKLLCYSWPGNLRELKNVIKRATLLAEDQNEITINALPSEILCNFEEVEDTYDLKVISDKKEKEIIINALEKVRYNKTKAAQILNIDRKTLYNKLKIYGIE